MYIFFITKEGPNINYALYIPPYSKKEMIYKKLQNSESSSDSDFVDASDYPTEENVSLKNNVTIKTESDGIKSDYVSLNSNNVKINLEVNEHRGGRYNKKTAPSPPDLKRESSYKTQHKEPSTIKATLVLKPGLVRSIEKISNNTNETKFFPKPLPRNKKTQRSKLSSVLKYLNRNDSANTIFNKRSSWHDVAKAGENVLLKQKSKSEEDFYSKRDLYLVEQECDNLHADEFEE